MSVLLLASLSSLSQAAEITEIPEELRGDVEVTYTYDQSRVNLYEATDDVGERLDQQHLLTYGGSFSPYEGTAVWFQLPHYASSSLAYSDTYEMVFDPNLDSGTMRNTDSLNNPPTVSGGGLGGLWIGARGTPFSEKIFTGRPDRITMLLDVGYRFKDNSNFYTTNDSGNRGGGPGAAAWRASMAVSTQHRAAEPYMRFLYQRDLNIIQDIRDDGGNVLKQNADLNPADNLEALAGVELLAFENEAAGTKVTVDFFTKLGYRSFQDVPSGIYLPSVVAVSDGDVVTQSETSYVRGGLGLNWRMFEYLQFNVGGDVGTHTAQRLEHPYLVRTGMDTLDFSVFTTMRMRIRDAKTAISGLSPTPESAAAPGQ